MAIPAQQAVSLATLVFARTNGGPNANQVAVVGQLQQRQHRPRPLLPLAEDLPHSPARVTQERDAESTKSLDLAPTSKRSSLVVVVLWISQLPCWRLRT